MESVILTFFSHFTKLDANYLKIIREVLYLLSFAAHQTISSKKKGYFSPKCQKFLSFQQKFLLFLPEIFRKMSAILPDRIPKCS